MADPDPAQGGYVNPADFISVLGWTDYDAPAEPTWKQDVESILSEYAQVYPVIRQSSTSTDYDNAVANKDALDTVFNLPQDNPHYMPVTRDLSPAKRQMILAWLQTTGNGGPTQFRPRSGCGAGADGGPGAGRGARGARR